MDPQFSFSQPASSVAHRIQPRSRLYRFLWRHFYWRLRKRKCILLLIWAISVSFTLVAVTRLSPRSVQEDQNQEFEFIDSTMSPELILEDHGDLEVGENDEKMDQDSIILALQDLIRERKNIDHHRNSKSHELGGDSGKPMPGKEQSEYVIKHWLQNAVPVEKRQGKVKKSTEEILKIYWHLKQRSRGQNNSIPISSISGIKVLDSDYDELSPQHVLDITNDEPGVTDDEALRFEPAATSDRRQYTRSLNCRLPLSSAIGSPTKDTAMLQGDDMLNTLLDSVMENHHSVEPDGADVTPNMDHTTKLLLSLLGKHLTVDQRACVELYLDDYLQKHKGSLIKRQLSLKDRKLLDSLNNHLQERFAKYQKNTHKSRNRF